MTIFGIFAIDLKTFSFHINGSWYIFVYKNVSSFYEILLLTGSKLWELYEINFSWLKEQSVCFQTILSIFFPNRLTRSTLISHKRDFIRWWEIFIGIYDENNSRSGINISLEIFGIDFQNTNCPRTLYKKEKYLQATVVFA